jgi:succinate dehydrogenase/fumarate reductase cytochrome b subunit
MRETQTSTAVVSDSRDIDRSPAAKLHTVLGAVVLGAFLVGHLLVSAETLRGRDAYLQVASAQRDRPGMAHAESLAVAVMVVFYVVFGVIRWARSPRGVVPTTSFAYWARVLQRCASVGALLFVCAHTWQLTVQWFRGVLPWQSFYSALDVSLNAPTTFAGYVLGITACVYYYAYTLWTTGNVWSVTVTPRAMRRSAWMCGLFGIVLWVLGINTVLHFGYRCGGILPTVEAQVMCRDADTDNSYGTEP